MSWACRKPLSHATKSYRVNRPLKNLRADLHGTIFVACDNCLRQAHDIVHDCCVRQEKCRSILKHVLKRYNNRKSCLRPVVSLSHATKSHRVNRPLLTHFTSRAVVVVVVVIREFGVSTSIYGQVSLSYLKYTSKILEEVYPVKLNLISIRKTTGDLHFERFSVKRGATSAVNSRGKYSFYAWYLVV